MKALEEKKSLPKFENTCSKQQFPPKRICLLICLVPCVIYEKNEMQMNFSNILFNILDDLSCH